MTHNEPWPKRLLRDYSGNIALISAASMVPILALIGGGLDMSRAYMAKTQLQSACDAGTLAGRRAMGKSGQYTETEQALARRMFDANFDAATIDAAGVTFLTASNDQSQVTGTATARMPTVVMKMFNQDNVEIKVDCMAELQAANTDIMFVLDTTGSMNGTRIAALREAVRGFHRTMNQAVTSDRARVRYGFVPYSMTVNANRLLVDPETPMPREYFVDSAPYESREAFFNTPVHIGTTVVTGPADETYPAQISSTDCSRYGANIFPTVGTNPQTSGSAPSDVTSKTFAFKSWAGTGGTLGWCTRTVTTSKTTYVTKYAFTNWRYKRVVLDTSAFKTGATVMVGTNARLPTGSIVNASERFTYADQPGYYDMVTMARLNGSTLRNVVQTKLVWRGCIEERETVDAASWSPVPDGAHDLDLFSAPTSEATRWRPLWERVTYLRSHHEYVDSFANPENAIQACPSPMQLLTEVDMTGNATDVPVWLDNYLNGLVASGGTYHDIGMIWGGRLSSPRGIFAENVNRDNVAVSRHLIFMSDGQMEPYISAYNAYGIEALSNRIAPLNSSTAIVSERHTARFRAACEAVKAEGITIWVVAFDTTLSSNMKACSSDGRAFYAADTAALQQQFRYIAAQVGNLRLSQ